MRDKLLIIGAGGHGKVCADVAIKMNKWSNISFLDGDTTKTEILSLKVIDNTHNIGKYIEDYDFFVSIGSNQIRKKIINQIENLNGHIVSLIHPSANIGLDVKIGTGTVIMAGASVNSGTIIENGVIINTNSSIDHDCQISNYVHVSPGANIAGTVRVGSLTWIGVGATIINNIRISSEVMVGAGAVVVKDIFTSGIYIGIPAKIYNEKK